MAEARITFTLNDGTKVESTFTPPYNVREQLDWEEEFRQSFYAVEAALAEPIMSEREGRPADPTTMLRTKWILWFGWHRARPAVAAKFAAFIDTLADYDIQMSDDAEGDNPEGEAAPSADAVDPTATEDHSALAP